MVENVIYILLFLCVILYANFYFRKSFEIDLKYFLAYVFTIFSLEVLCYFLYEEKINTMFIYYIITFLEFNFLFLFFRTLFEKKTTKKNVLIIIYIFNIIYVLSSLYYVVQGEYLSKYNIIASVSGSVLMTIILFLFFKYFLDSNKILNYKKSLSFWISCGLLVYYLGTIPITSIFNSLDDIPKEQVSYMFKVQIILSFIMYGSFIFGSLWSQKKVR